MNTLLDGLINSDSDEYYSSRAFDMDFSEYFLPTGTEDQTKLRTHAQRAVEWMGHIADDPVYDAEHSINRVRALDTQLKAIGMMVISSLLANTQHGEDNED